LWAGGFLRGGAGAFGGDRPLGGDGLLRRGTGPLGGDSPSAGTGPRWGEAFCGLGVFLGRRGGSRRGDRPFVWTGALRGQGPRRGG
jgi:hypothetical protein